MPPDPSGGADACVRDTPRFLVSASSGVSNVVQQSLSTLFPPSPPASPAPSPMDEKMPPLNFVKLPLTPTSSIESLSSLEEGENDPNESDNFLDAVFPKLPALAASARSIEDDRWQLAIVNQRKLYARCSGGYADLCLRENVVDLLDRAAEEMECDGLIMCLDKTDPDLAELLHSLMYVGGTIVSPANSAHDTSKFVLVGIDI